jgi:hypothetical protein
MNCTVLATCHRTELYQKNRFFGKPGQVLTPAVQRSYNSTSLMTFYEEGIVPFIFRVLSYYLVNILYKPSFIV